LLSNNRSRRQNQGRSEHVEDHVESPYGVLNEDEMATYKKEIERVIQEQLMRESQKRLRLKAPENETEFDGGSTFNRDDDSQFDATG